MFKYISFDNKIFIETVPTIMLLCNDIYVLVSYTLKYK